MSRCTGLTSKNKRCKRPALFGTEMCWSHAETCPVCLDKIGTRDDTSTLGCGHSFHAGCIYKWLERDSRCPMCRSETRDKVTLTIHYNSDDDLPPEDIMNHTIRNLIQENRVRTDVWIRRSYVFTNELGENIAILDT